MKNMKQIAAAAVTRVGNTRAKASKIITTTATTHANQGDEQSGSGRHGGFPPPPSSYAVAPASGIRYGACLHPGGNPSAPATDRPTAARHLPRVRRQHCLGKNSNFTRCSCSRLVRGSAVTCLNRCLLLVFLPARRPVYPVDGATLASVASPRAPPPPATKSYGAVQVTGACASDVVSLNQGTEDRASSATPPATGAHASSAAPVRYGSIQATRACASGAALNFGTGDRAQITSPPATRRAVVNLLRLHVAPFSEGVLPLPLPAMRWRSV